jgi:type I restriction enzyme S subunit
MVPEELDGQIASTGYCVLRSDKSKVDPRYLYAHLLTDGFIARMGRLERGAGYPAVRETDVFASPLPLPPLPEQQRIAQVLSTVQEAIAQQERLIRTTAELMQALMQKLFTEGLRGEALKETEIGRVPESWSMSIIGAEANVTKLAGYEYTKYIKYTDEGEIIAIRGVNLKDGKLDLSDVKRIWRDVSEELPRSQLHPGDVLLSYVGTVGSVAMVEDDGKYHLAPNVAKLTPKDDKRLIPEFLLAYLRTDIGRTDLFRSVSQTSQPVISMARIRSLHLPLPDVDEQASIVATLSVADRKLDNASRKRNALQDLFRTLLHELMTGKVRVGEID